MLRELLFPDRCISCGSWGSALCRSCLSRIRGFGRYGNVYAFGFYNGPLKELIWAVKYGGYGKALDILVNAFRDSISSYLEGSIDVIISVPEDPSRRRTFNHVLYLSKLLSGLLSVPVSRKLCKIRSTPPQVKLSKKDREENLKEVFVFKGELLLGKRILLVDDVLTTGTTLRACEDVITRGGALTVKKLVIAVNR